MQNQQDGTAKMVLDGLFLSLQEQQIIRFVLYDAQYKVILQQSTKLPLYPPLLPKLCGRSFRKRQKILNFTIFSVRLLTRRKTHP